MSLDFYTRVGKAYGKDGPVWTFEPHVAEAVFRDLVTENEVAVLFEHRIVAAEKNATRLARITLEHAPPQPNGAPAPAAVKGSKPAVVEAEVFLDCSYEGDVMAAARVTYAVGRESVAQYGEPLNGIRAETPQHQFQFPVDPYFKPGDPASGLLPLIQSGDGGKPGEGDRSVQGYNFRLCLTNEPRNRLPIGPPPGYDPARYELLARHVEALVADGKGKRIGELLKPDMVTQKKTDVNNNGAVSTDFIGANYGYPDGDYATRARIWTEHLHYVQGLLHFLATSPRVPQHLRDEMNQWGLARDEFTDTGGWPHQLYVREARRMVGAYVITQADCEHRTKVDDSVGLGAYNMDSHNCQRVVQGGVVRNEGNVQVAPAAPYAIPYRAITPRAQQCTNLLVPVCFSASHIAYGSARMEPVFMVLGQSAAVAACMAIDGKTGVQDVDVATLQAALRSAGQVLAWDAPPRARGIDPGTLGGIVVDDGDARFSGEWAHSIAIGGFIGAGYRHDDNAAKGNKTATFSLKVTRPGRYKVRIAYTANGNRATNVPVTIELGAGTTHRATLDQRKPPTDPVGFATVATVDLAVGEFRVVISNDGTDGHVIADAVQIVPVRE
ncbi:MAG: FAD-dependent oxidoreductase [Chloroflexota bacterium]|nr:FAD-dependent oxidoreductase [Chloroflexota bacterium]